MLVWTTTPWTLVANVAIAVHPDYQYAIVKTAKETLIMVEDAVRAGARGVAMGRNAFQHESPEKLVKAVCQIVHEGKTANEAIKILQ